MKNLLIGFVLWLSLVMPSHAEIVKIRDLYEKGTKLSQFTLKSEGKFIEIEGYMAPPLQAESTFFVLTKRPMSVCPFCETDADWPDDILAIYTKRIIKVTDFNTKIVVRGKLAIGSFTDKATGFVSQLRLESSVYDVK